MSDSGQYDRMISFNPAILGDDVRLNLGVCYARLGKLKAAEQTFRQLIVSPTRGQQSARDSRSAAIGFLDEGTLGAATMRVSHRAPSNAINQFAHQIKTAVVNC